MKKTILTAIVILAGVGANASSMSLEDHCKMKADQALAKVAEALGMGKGVGHIGGTELIVEEGITTSDTLVFGGGMLAAEDTDGYLSGTGATVEMLLNGTKCEVNKVNIETGADFRAALDREIKK